MSLACSLHLATLACAHGLDRHSSFMMPSGFSAYLLGHTLCWHPVPSGTHPASNHGIKIVVRCQAAHTLPETKGHDHGGRATLASESAVRIYPHLGQRPGYPSALLPRQPGDPSFSDCAQVPNQGRMWHICRQAPSKENRPRCLGSLPQSPAGALDKAQWHSEPETATNTMAGQL